MIRPKSERLPFLRKWEEMAWPNQAAMFNEREKTDRTYLVKRQHGTTFGLAVEAGIVQMKTGRVQCFIAPTIAQAKLDHYSLKAFFGNDYQPKQFLFLGVGCNLDKYIKDIDGPVDVYVAEHRYMSAKELNQLAFLFEKLRESGELVRVTYSSCMPGNEYDMCICGSPEGFIFPQPGKQARVCCACDKESNDA